MTGPHSCSRCNRTFATKSASDMHSRDAHPPAYECKECNRKFRSEQAWRAHNLDKHGRGGDTRNRNGGARKSRQLHVHPPPHEDIEGYWVQTSDFEGQKSFGRFQCKKCKKQWGSAHAFRDYKQGCQRCETKSFPCCLWVNTGDNNERQERDDDNDGPHDSKRCEACRHGRCSFQV